jgi:hypothetical protein
MKKVGLRTLTHCRFEKEGLRPVVAVGGFPIRLAKTQHLDKQRDSEKKKNAIRKSSARNDQIRGLFGSPP